MADMKIETLLGEKDAAIKALTEERRNLIETKHAQIEEMRKENSRLKGEINLYKQMFDDCVRQYNGQMLRAEKAEKRADIFKDALSYLASLDIVEYALDPGIPSRVALKSLKDGEEEQLPISEGETVIRTAGGSYMGLSEGQTAKVATIFAVDGSECYTLSGYEGYFKASNFERYTPKALKDQ